MRQRDSGDPQLNRYDSKGGEYGDLRRRWDGGDFTFTDLGALADGAGPARGC